MKVTPNMKWIYGRLLETGVNPKHFGDLSWSSIDAGAVILSVDVPNCCPMVELFTADCPVSEAFKLMKI